MAELNTHGLSSKSLEGLRVEDSGLELFFLREEESLSVARKLWRLRGIFRIRSHPSWGEICKRRLG